MAQAPLQVVLFDSDTSDIEMDARPSVATLGPDSSPGLLESQMSGAATQPTFTLSARVPRQQSTPSTKVDKKSSSKSAKESSVAHNVAILDDFPPKDANKKTANIGSDKENKKSATKKASSSSKRKKSGMDTLASAGSPVPVAVSEGKSATSSTKNTKKAEKPAEAEASASAKKSHVKKPAKKKKSEVAEATAARSAEETTPAKVQEPPKKKKKLTFQDQVFQTMLDSFQPFTLKTLAQAMQTTDTALNYVMLSLVDKNLVTKKEFTSKSGRTKELYWANYGVKSKDVRVSQTASPEEMDAARQQLVRLQGQASALAQALGSASDELSNEEINEALERDQAEMDQLQQQVAGVRERLQRASQEPPTYTKEELQKYVRYMRQEWKTRKTQCMDAVDMLADGLEKTPSQVMSMLEVETDEAAGVTMPVKK